MNKFLESDLEHIISQSQYILPYFKDKRIFITGGTGFFGRWLLAAFLKVNDQFDLNLKLTVLTRNPEAFSSSASWITQHSCIKLLAGDVRSFDFPNEQYDYVIHGATAANLAFSDISSSEMYETIMQGTKRMLEFARVHDVSRFLLISSGAVYGKRLSDKGAFCETDDCFPNPEDAYALGKYDAEQLAQAYQYNIGLRIARPFAFVGPYLPLDMQYAIGNFINDGLQGRKIHILGDGSAYRSYLYTSDLVVYLWHILIFGQVACPYNVGGEQALSILELATMISKYFQPNLEVVVAKEKSKGPVPYYVPDISRAKQAFGIAPTVSLGDAIQKTITWHRHVEGC